MGTSAVEARADRLGPELRRDSCAAAPASCVSPQAAGDVASTGQRFGYDTRRQTTAPADFVTALTHRPDQT
jgi:hypothetical protein